ncbi:helix-turn-helix domain-containing protein [Streptomyces sp. NPDC002790]|uniref:AraC family transcriptional regulator n=1 Tax=Streptomyces sp. NPDC002790 TaxID=3154431 RepID=UPI00332E595C
MLSSRRPSPDWTSVDIAVPRPRDRLPGVSMAGFLAHGPPPAGFDRAIAMVAHPFVTLLIDLSEGGAQGDGRDDGRAGGLFHEAGGRRGYGSIAVGLLPRDVRTGGSTGECLQIRLRPAVATAVLGASVDLSGAVVPLADLWGRDAVRAEERLRAADSWDDRFAIAAALIGRRLAVRRVDPEVAFAWRRAFGLRGQVRVDGLADEIGWSRKRLSARFHAQLGISPKRAARLIRFDHAAHLLAAGRPAADTATASGYVDQPHLHRDVREFTGLTPTALAAAPWLSIDDVAWPDSAPGRRAVARPSGE